MISRTFALSNLSKNQLLDQGPRQQEIQIQKPTDFKNMWGVGPVLACTFFPKSHYTISELTTMGTQGLNHQGKTKKIDPNPCVKCKAQYETRRNTTRRCVSARTD
jgi:hypothetical protein